MNLLVVRLKWVLAICLLNIGVHKPPFFQNSQTPGLQTMLAGICLERFGLQSSAHSPLRLVCGSDLILKTGPVNSHQANSKPCWRSEQTPFISAASETCSLLPATTPGPTTPPSPALPTPRHTLQPFVKELRGSERLTERGTWLLPE